MIIKTLCIIWLWMKVSLALEELIGAEGIYIMHTAHAGVGGQDGQDARYGWILLY